MSYLAILVLAQFAALYPLLLWQMPEDTLPAGFARFNLGMTTVLLAMATVLAAAAGLAPLLMKLALLLAAITLVLQRLLWHQPGRARRLLTPLMLVWGVTLWQPVLGAGSIQAPLLSWIAIALGGLSLGAVMYAMILGHWYLNEAELPVRHLQRATAMLLIVLVTRLAWTVGILLLTETVVQQRLKPAYMLLGELDGIFLWIGLLPGLLGSVAVAWMARRTAAMQSTQSTTGLLYVALVLVAMSTISFSGYLLLMDLPL